uniref:non-specific serine/threonine protein kinase n=1 Tax=Ananas comosus var. bracteatus TaxID=296719 RepID=A0A6V7QLU3_ANACO|nr:unnamed protein product [Ananas comosus var. bracteatus]
MGVPTSTLILSLFLVSSYFLYYSCPCEAAATGTAGIPVGTIERTTKQQILVSIPPGATGGSVPFLTSPSGKYVAYLLRRPTAKGAGGFGSDFCYVEVEDASSGSSMWESECTPVSTVNSCALLFTWNGLEVFDGSTSVWDTGAQSADNNFLETLELVDEGDMRIRDKDGELAWKASDDPRANQDCGLPGSPGVAPALPPFAEPIGKDNNLPFGQAGQGGGQGAGGQLPEVHGVSQTVGFGSQPLVDNSPYDSGCLAGIEHWVGSGLGLGLIMVLVQFGFGF